MLCVAVCFGVAVIYVCTATKVYEAEADLLISPAPRDSDSLSACRSCASRATRRATSRPSPGSSPPTPSPRRVRANLGTDRTTRAGCSTPSRPSRSPRATSSPSPRSGSTAEEAAGARQRVRPRHRRGPDASSCTTSSTRCCSAWRRSREDAAEPAAAPRGAGAADHTSSRRCAAAPTRPSGSRTRPSCRPRRSRRGRCSAPSAASSSASCSASSAPSRSSCSTRALRREDQLRALSRLPVLGRVPREAGARRRCGPSGSSPATHRGLPDAARHAVGRRGPGRARARCSSPARPPSEGKTTTAINLAASLALAGHRVILIEADLRRPSIGRSARRRAASSTSWTSCSRRRSSRTRSSQTEGYGREPRGAARQGPGEDGTPNADGLFLPTARALIDRREGARRLRDHRLAAAHRGHRRPARSPSAPTRCSSCPARAHPASRIVHLGELLAQHDIEPVGIAVVGVPASRHRERLLRPDPAARRRRPRGARAQLRPEAP